MPDDTIEDVAERIDRCADRFRDASDRDSERAAHEAAAAARQCGSVEAALRIERAFLLACGIMERPAIPPPTPKVGTAPESNTPYVYYGENVRAGGSRGWRNNNPGYLPCNDAVLAYGAIGCDGPYAIFPDEDVGRRAAAAWLRDHYPESTLREALQQMIPSEEAGQGVPDRVLQHTGIDPNSPTDDLSDEELNAVAAALQADPAWVPGESYDINIGTAPDWVERLWEEDEETHGQESPAAEAGRTTGSPGPSDNS